LEKVFEQVLKYVPADIVPAVLALTVAFFGVYYYKGIRSYTDALNDPSFLTLSVIIAGAFLILQIQKPDSPRIPQDVRPLLLVPRFENDSGRELEALFVTQLRAAVERSRKDSLIVQVNAYVPNQDTAQLNGKSVKAVAILFEPKIVREGGNNAVLCFRVLFVDSGRVSTFSAVPTELDKMNLNDLSNALLASPINADAALNDPVVARLDLLERKVGELSNALLKTSALIRPSPKGDYPKKRAVVIGVNYVEHDSLPRLRYAVSDARAMAAVLDNYGFETSLLLDEGATLARVQDAIISARDKSNKNDLLLIYFAGAGVRSPDLGDRKSKKLILPTYDLQSSKPAENLSLTV
jgi:Caspase domain